jgi:hypothetical protein
MAGSIGSSDFPLSKLLKQMVCKQFSADADVKQAITSSLRALNKNFFYAEIQFLVPR